MFLDIYGLGTDYRYVVGYRRRTLQHSDKTTLVLLRIVYGLAYVLLVVETLALHIVCYGEVVKAAVGLQLLGVECSLDCYLQLLGRDLVLMQESHNRKSGTLRCGAQHHSLGVQIVCFGRVEKAETAIFEFDCYFLSVFHNE